MTKYILKRLGFALLALFVVITLIFFLGQLLPGFPFDLTGKETAAEIQAKLESLGLTDNLLVQYGRFWGNLLTKCEFGQNFRNPAETIPFLFGQVMPYTLSISSIAFVLGVILGVTLGVIAAVYRGKLIDTLINILSVFFISVPSFVLATFFIRIAADSNWPIWFPSIGTDGFEPGKMIQASILPISALVISMAPPLVYYTRNEMVDVLNQDYIKTALAKGLSYPTVIFRHGLRNCLIPIISVSVPMLLVVIGGSIIIEKFYGVPGIADQLVRAVQQKEVYLLMFNALVISGIYYLLQILADISFTWIDPRIKLADSKSKDYIAITKNNLTRKNMLNKYKKMEFKEIDYKSDLYKYIKNNSLANFKRKKIFLPEELLSKNNLSIKEKVVYSCEIFKIELETNNYHKKNNMKGAEL